MARLMYGAQSRKMANIVLISLDQQTSSGKKSCKHQRLESKPPDSSAIQQVV